MRLRNIPSAREELAQSPYVIKEEEYSKLRGNWAQIFGNEHPVRIEIGMGKGQFLLELARRNPEMNYVGIERYSSVLVHPVRKLQAQNRNPIRQQDVELSPIRQQDVELNPIHQQGVESNDIQLQHTEQKDTHLTDMEQNNIRLLRMDAEQLTEIFAPGEVDRIYLNFSDPWPKDRHAKRRLPGRTFLARYAQVLPPGGQVEFKTDNRSLFDFAVEEARAASWTVEACTYDLHHDPVLNEGNVMTEYEKRFSEQGNPICKLIIGVPESRQDDLK